MKESGYVSVRDEPLHRHRFENTFARVYDVYIAPGEQTLYHEHTEDTLYVSVCAALTGDQVWGKASAVPTRCPQALPCVSTTAKSP